MNRQSSSVLFFGTVVLALMAASALAVTVSAAPAAPSTELSAVQVSVLQPPPPPVSYTLTVNILPAGGGTVTKNPNLPVYISGTVVSLTANPAVGFQFNNWTGDASGTSTSTNVTMTANRTVNANFSALPCFTLSTSVPGGGGTITVNTAANCGGTQYYSGTVVSLTANANSGYTFSSWGGGASGSANPTTVTMNSAKSVTATFTAAPACYSLSTAVSPLGTGSVTVNTPSNCTGGYTSGTVVTLTAIPASGYLFSSWSGNASGSANPTTVTMTANRSVTANFVAIAVPTNTFTPGPTSTSAAAATITPLSGAATITPLSGGVVSTATVAPTATPTSSMPPTGAPSFIWIAAGIVLVLIILGTRALRQSSM